MHNGFLQDFSCLLPPGTIRCNPPLVSYFPQLHNAPWHPVAIPLSSYTGDVLVRFRQVNGNGNNTCIDDIAIGTPAGTATLEGSQSLRVYPVPARDEVRLGGLPANVPLRLTDLSGQLLQEQISTASSTAVDLRRLTPGIYLLSSPYGTAKLVKE